MQRIALDAGYADRLASFLRANPRSSERGGAVALCIGGRRYTGFHDYRATEARERGGRHDAGDQELHTLLIDDVAHARQHLPGFGALAADAALHVPEKGLELLHAHILDQASPHVRFSNHQDTEENRPRGARRADREVVYTVVLKLNRGGDSAMRILGCEDVVYASEPATGIVFLSELWHRTCGPPPERSS